METELVYYRRRAADERLAAAGATSSRARAVHLELARLYGDRIEALTDERGEALLTLVPAA